MWNFQILIVSAVRICKQCLQTASANPLPGLYPWTPLSPRFPGAIAPMKIPGATTVNLVHIPLQCLVKPCFQWPRNSNAFQAKLNYKPLNVGILAYSRQIWYRHILYINETWWQLWYMFASFLSMVYQSNVLHLWFHQRSTKVKIMPRSHMAKFLFCRDSQWLRQPEVFINYINGIDPLRGGPKTPHLGQRL